MNYAKVVSILYFMVFAIVIIIMPLIILYKKCFGLYILKMGRVGNFISVYQYIQTIDVYVSL